MAGFYDQLPKDALVLSPMAGFSDSPYRHLCRKFGSAYSITEFVSTSDLFRGRPSAISLFRYLEAERPIVFQVFGNDPDIIVRAVERILVLNPDGIDLNMGCSVRKVAHHGSGAGLLREPRKVEKIISGLRKITALPVSAKIRMGWDHDNLNYPEIARILEDQGIAAIAMHGRTKKMGYTGSAEWDKIADLASRVKVPVFGNGDLCSAAEAKLKIRQYSLAGAFIGRQPVGNPWLFDKDNRNELSLAQRLPVMLEHFDAMRNFYGDNAATILFRKHFTKYTDDLDIPFELRNCLLTMQSADGFIEKLMETSTGIADRHEKISA